MATPRERTPEAPGDDTVHYVSAREKRDRAKARMQPPLTPMIDVTFQLLLFFLLAFTFRAAEGVLPYSTTGNSGRGPEFVLPIPIRIQLKPVGRLGESVLYEVAPTTVVARGPSELYRTLVGLREKLSDETPVVIEPYGKVRWEYAVEACNQARRAAFQKIIFAKCL
jgi:biopolymer transport protein ExbD